MGWIYWVLWFLSLFGIYAVTRISFTNETFYAIIKDSCKRFYNFVKNVYMYIVTLINKRKEE